MYSHLAVSLNSQTQLNLYKQFDILIFDYTLMKHLQTALKSISQLKTIFKTKAYDAYSQRPKQIIRQIMKNQQQTIPMAKLDALSQLSYDIGELAQIVYVVKLKLNSCTGKSKCIKTTYNLMTLICYLIKNGSSTIIDHFKDMLTIISSIEHLNVQQSQLWSHKDHKRLIYLLSQIRHRAQYIQMLLVDGQMLHNERSMSKVIRQQMVECGKIKNVKPEQSCEESSNELKMGSFMLEHQTKEKKFEYKKQYKQINNQMRKMGWPNERYIDMNKLPGQLADNQNDKPTNQTQVDMASTNLNVRPNTIFRL